MGQVDILGNLAGKDVVRGCVDAKAQLCQQLKYLVVVDGVGQVGHAGAKRNWLQPLRKLTDCRRVVVFFNVPPERDKSV